MAAQKSAAPALVLEGGGFRGMFTAGVLDVLMERGLTGFSSAWGVSAGAINAANFRAGQIGRTMRDILAFRDDRRFVSLWSLAATGDMAGADFMYDEVQNRLDPFDAETFNGREASLPMFAVVSDVTFGTAAYLPVRHFPEDVTKVRASASLPAVSNIVEIDGHRYLDGGTTDSIPFATAMGLDGAPEVLGARPADRALVVLTQDRTYVKRGTTERTILRSRRYSAYPYYKQALATRSSRYNAQREELAGLEAEGRALVLRPPEPVRIRTPEHDGEPLLRLYLQGRNEAERHLDHIQGFMYGT